MENISNKSESDKISDQMVADSNKILMLSNFDLILSRELIGKVWEFSKQVADEKPKLALELMSKLSFRSKDFPPAWREEVKELLWDTVDLVDKVKGSDFQYHRQLGDIIRQENNFISSANIYKIAADAIGRERRGDRTTGTAGDRVRAERRRFLRDAAACFIAGGDGGLASDCYVDMMRLKAETATWSRRAWLKLGWYLWGWGERPLHVALSACLLVMVYAVCYWIAGLKNVEPNGPSRVLDSLYFSVITFATVGYGDITPETGWSKLLAASEGLLGIFFTGLFLVVFVKRSSR